MMKNETMESNSREIVALEKLLNMRLRGEHDVFVEKSLFPGVDDMNRRLAALRLRREELIKEKRTRDAERRKNSLAEDTVDFSILDKYKTFKKKQRFVGDHGRYQAVQLSGKSDDDAPGFVIHFSLSTAYRAIRRQESGLTKPPSKVNPGGGTPRKISTMHVFFDREERRWKTHHEMKDRQEDVKGKQTQREGSDRVGNQDKKKQSKATSAVKHNKKSLKKPTSRSKTRTQHTAEDIMFDTTLWETEVLTAQETVVSKILREIKVDLPSVSFSERSVTEGSDVTGVSRQSSFQSTDSLTVKQADMCSDNITYHPVTSPRLMLQQQQGESRTAEEGHSAQKKGEKKSKVPRQRHMINADQPDITRVREEENIDLGEDEADIKTEVSELEKGEVDKVEGMLEGEEGEQAEGQIYTTCSYMYRLHNCKAVTDPLILQQAVKEDHHVVGTIEIYDGHGVDGTPGEYTVCQHCMIEPERRIIRWLDSIDTGLTSGVYARGRLNSRRARTRKRKALAKFMENATRKELSTISESLT